MLADSGRCAFIIPSEFLNADYGVTVKKYLCADPAFLGIIAFDFRENLFDKVLTTSCIVLFERGLKNRHLVSFVSISDPSKLGAAFLEFDEGNGVNQPSGVKVRSVVRKDLDVSTKWKNYFQVSRVSAVPTAGFSELGAYAGCSRGIATGSNDFFTLNETKRLELGISKEDLSRCVTKSKDIPDLIFEEADFDRLAKTDARVYLLNPKLPVSEAIERYLAEGEEQEIDRLYLPAHRRVWYRPENQEPAQVWVMVFSRSVTRFVWNKAGVNHLTTFHGLYPTLAGTAYIAPLLLYLWSDTCQVLMEDQQRQYGSGLKKYEPRDIEKILVPKFESWPDEWIAQAQTYLNTIEGERLRCGSSREHSQRRAGFPFAYLAFCEVAAAISLS